MSKKEKIENQIKRFLPDGYASYIADLIINNKVRIVITKPRKTKYGDFSSNKREKKPTHKITINGNLNKYQFLITILHEFAHLYVYEKHKDRVPPHGIEWKTTFKELLLPVINDENIPRDIRMALNVPAQRLKASSATDLRLKRALDAHSISVDKTTVILESLHQKSYFSLNENIFQLGELRRTRFICRKVKTNKLYLVNRLAEVKYLKDYSE